MVTNAHGELVVRLHCRSGPGAGPTAVPLLLTVCLCCATHPLLLRNMRMVGVMPKQPL